MSQLGQLEADLAQFRQKNTEVIAIAAQDQAGAQASASTAQVSYPVLADPDHQVADAYGVYNLLGDGVATPAVFVINKSGQIAWSYIGQNISDRPNNQTILENLPAD
ncbi:MAG: peroxiredoxin family protein [Anaerolineae bacterium]|nr:peroxiredoxin family protein [Anaerolineae bacterium]